MRCVAVVRRFGRYRGCNGWAWRSAGKITCWAHTPCRHGFDGRPAA